MKGNMLTAADLALLSTEELARLIREETTKPEPDDDLVLDILHILEAREKARLYQLSPEEARAAERATISSRRKLVYMPRWMVTAVSAALLVIVLVAVIPQRAKADNFWEMLQRWSDSILEILNPREHMSTLDYQFETDNPGLQQVYDAVTELGITDPVVPMWLPAEYELTRLQNKQTPMLSGIWSWFCLDDDELVYKVNVYKGEPAHQFYRDDVHYEEYEKNGMTFRITQNNGSWVAVWTKENIECSISIDCQEETLRRVLRSIFEMEDYE